jgi:hypothetical protein
MAWSSANPSLQTGQTAGLCFWIFCVGKKAGPLWKNWNQVPVDGLHQFFNKSESPRVNRFQITAWIKLQK